MSDLWVGLLIGWVAGLVSMTAALAYSWRSMRRRLHVVVQGEVGVARSSIDAHARYTVTTVRAECEAEIARLRKAREQVGSRMVN